MQPLLCPQLVSSSDDSRILTKFFVHDSSPHSFLLPMTLELLQSSLYRIDIAYWWWPWSCLGLIQPGSLPLYLFTGLCSLASGTGLHGHYDINTLCLGSMSLHQEMNNKISPLLELTHLGALRVWYHWTVIISRVLETWKTTIALSLKSMKLQRLNPWIFLAFNASLRSIFREKRNEERSNTELYYQM